MIYQLPENIDSNKIFIINRSEIGKRLDPYFYQSKFDVIMRKLLKLPHSTIKNKSVKIFSGITPLSKGDAYSDITNGIAFVRSGDFSEDNIIKLEDTNYIKKSIHEKMMKGSKLLKDDLLIAIVGATIGKVGVYKLDSEANINQAICAVRFNKEINPDFIQIYLLTGFGQLILDRLKRPVARANINLEEIGSIPIPILSPEKQGSIVDFYYDKIKIKHQKELEVKNILNSIDTYLLNELGIVLPKKDNSLQNRIFTTNLSKVSGGRFDPKLYDNNTTALKNAILERNSDGFKVIQLSDYVIESVAGDWGLEFDDESEDYTKCLVVRATEFDNIYNLNLNNSRVKYRYIKTKKLKKIDIKTDDLLIEKSGGSPDQPVGRISIITQDMVDNYQLCYSNFIHKIRVISNVLNPQYMFCYLKVMHNIKLTESMQSQTNGIRNLIMREYLQQPIVVPITKSGDIDINKQIEIANHIANIRDKAKQLQQEAKDILDKAKIDVEKMILGE